MLEQLQFAIRPLSEHRRAERLHNLLDGNILVGELVSRRAIFGGGGEGRKLAWMHLPAGTKSEKKAQEREGKLTRQDQTLPCPQAGGLSIYTN